MMPHGAPGRGVHVCVCARVCACVCARACVRVCVRALRVRASQAHLRGGAAAQQEATNRQRATHPRPGFQPFGRAAPARAPPAPHPGQQPALPWRLPPLQLRRRRPCPLARLRGCVCACVCGGGGAGGGGDAGGGANQRGTSWGPPLLAIGTRPCPSWAPARQCPAGAAPAPALAPASAVPLACARPTRAATHPSTRAWRCSAAAAPGPAPASEPAAPPPRSQPSCA